MKKIITGVLAVAAIALIYFYTAGSGKLNKELKHQLDTELSTMQQNGFVIETRSSTPKKEHFVIDFDDPKKMAAYFKRVGSKATVQDIAALKGLKMGVDITYQPDLYSALSMDLYPLTLPDSIRNAAEDDEDKKVLAQIEKMLAQKKVLMHIDLRKDLSAFKGYLKDIHETLRDDSGSVTLSVKGATFEGTLKKGALSTLNQKIVLLGMESSDGIKAVADKTVTTYTSTGPSPYDMDANYTVANITVAKKGQGELALNDLAINTSEKEQNGLLSSSVIATIAKSTMQAQGQTVSMKQIVFDARTDNLDAKALEVLQNSDPEKNEAAFNAALKQLLSKGVKMTVNRFAVDKIVENGNNLGDIEVKASLEVAPGIDFAQVEQNPMLLLGAIDATTTLSLSQTIASMIAKDPRAMMVMMLIPPKEEKGKKIYNLILKDGKFTVNGVPL